MAAPPSVLEEPGPRPALLGREESALRAEFGAALQSQPIESRRVLNPGKVEMPSDAPVDSGDQGEKKKDVDRDGASTNPKDPFAGQQRLKRKPEAGDIQSVEYELFGRRVYRVRWQFDERFEQPLMTSLVAHLTTMLGKPYYDQLIEGKFGTGRATLRRAGWRSGSRSLEIRQLNPQVGGPIFLTLADQAIIQAIVESGGTAAPEPDSIGSWWQKPVKSVARPTTSERDALFVAFDGVLADVGWERVGADDTAD